MWAVTLALKDPHHSSPPTLGPCSFPFESFVLSHPSRASLTAPAMRETWVRSLGREDPLKKE